MERLTARNPKNNLAYLTKVKQDEQDIESEYPNTLKAILESFQRLAEYEDRDITPEGIDDLLAEVERLRKDLCTPNFKTVINDVFEDELEKLNSHIVCLMNERMRLSDELNMFKKLSLMACIHTAQGRRNSKGESDASDS